MSSPLSLRGVAARAVPVTPRRDLRFHAEVPLLFFLSLAVFLASGFVETLSSGLYLPETLAETAEAGQVFGSLTPGLSHLGRPFPPLATLVEASLGWVVHPSLLVAVLLSSGCAAALAVCLLASLHCLGLGRIQSLLVVAGLCLSPWTLALAAGGASASLASALLLGTLASLVRWAVTRRDRWLALAGFIYAVDVLASDNFLPLAFALGALICLIARQRDEPAQKQALLVTFFLPALFVVPVRVILSFVVAHASPLLVAPSAEPPGLVFLTELTCLVACAVVLASPLAHRTALVQGLASFTLLCGLLQLLAGLGSWPALAPGIVVLQALALILLTSAPPSGVRSALLATFVASALVVPALGALPESADPVASMLSADGARAWPLEQAAANTVARLPLDGPILLDDRVGYPIIALSGTPSRFLTPGDSGFQEALQQPQEAGSLLVSSSLDASQVDAIATVFPFLAQGQQDVPWAVQAAEFLAPSPTLTTWRVFIVTQEP